MKYSLLVDRYLNSQSTVSVLDKLDNNILLSNRTYFLCKCIHLVNSSIIFCCQTAHTFYVSVYIHSQSSFSPAHELLSDS